MRGIAGRGIVWLTVAATFAVRAAVARAGEGPPVEPAYVLADRDLNAGPLGPAPGSPEAGDLARRVADLEQALQKAAEKEAAEKKKASGRPGVSVFGRLQMDGFNFDQNARSRDQVGHARNGVEFRRARIGVRGDFAEVFEYQVEVDFANRDADQVINTNGQSTAFKDTYIAMKELPLFGAVRVGHYKEPFGLEQLTSDNFPTFLERSLGDEGGFVPARNPGVMAYDHTENERATWAIGAFVADSADQPVIYQNDDGGCALTMRGTWLPWYDEASQGRGLLHTGLAYSYRDAADGIVRFRVRPEAHLGPLVVDLRLDEAENWQLFGAEAALVYGPFSMQSEFFGSTVRRAPADNTFTGMYVYFSYFLTGENRAYRRDYGIFDRVRPFENFFRVRDGDGCIQTGWGAWEIGYRYSYVDFLDALVATNGAGQVSDHTIGVNWYWNPYSRLMFNYVNSSADRVTGGALLSDGTMHIFEMRAQVDF